MADPHPWRPDPADNRTPIGAPDTSASPFGAVSQERPHLGVVQRNDIGRLNRLPAVARPGLILGFLHQACLVGLSQAEGSLAEHLMHRRRAGGVQAAQVIPEQPGVDAQDMVVGGVIKHFVGQLRGGLKKLVGFVFGHGRILDRTRGGRHSEFPRVVAMSSSSFFLAQRTRHNGA